MVADALAAFKAPPEVLARWRGLDGGDGPDGDGVAADVETDGDGAPVFLIRPDVVKAVTLFAALGTQWRHAGGGLGPAVRTGLDYRAVEATAGMMGIRMTPGIFADLRVMEAEALRVFAEAARRDAERRDREARRGRGRP